MGPSELRRHLARSTAATFGGLPRAYWTLWTGILINRLGGFVVPFLGLYLTRGRGLGVEQAGLIVSLHGVGSLTASLLGGVLADRIGRRATLLLALCGGGATMLALGFARGLPQIAALVFLLALTSDLQRPATAAMIADVVPPADRLRAYGLQHWAVNIGFSVAPVIAGLLANLSYVVLFVGDAATTLAYAALVYARLPEPPAPAARREPILSGLATVARDGKFLAFVGLNVLVGVIYNQVNVALAVDLGAHGISARGYGAIVAVNGLLIVLLSPAISARLARAPRGPVLAAAALLTGAGFALQAPAESGLAFAGAVVIWTLGEIASAPAASALVADRAPPALRGRYQGAFMMSWGCSAFLGPSLGSLLLGRLGADSLWLACGVVGLVAAAGFWLVVRSMGGSSAR